MPSRTDVWTDKVICQVACIYSTTLLIKALILPIKWKVHWIIFRCGRCGNIFTTKMPSLHSVPHIPPLSGSTQRPHRRRRVLLTIIPFHIDRGLMLSQLYSCWHSNSGAVVVFGRTTILLFSEPSPLLQKAFFFEVWFFGYLDYYDYNVDSGEEQ